MDSMTPGRGVGVLLGRQRRWPAAPRGWDRTRAPDVDVWGLQKELERQLRGEVRFDDGARALYSTDGSNYRQVPIGVVVPRDSVDVIRTVAVCRRFGAPLLNRGGGTSLAGQCCNVAVVMDFSKYMHRILEVNPQERWARVQPGCVLDHLRFETQKKYKLTFAPDPSTHNRCTLGGMLGNNSCGVHSVMAGQHKARTSDNTLELDILTYDGVRMRVGATSDDELERIIRGGGRRGEIYGRLKALRDRYADLIRRRYPDIPRRVSGYNLDELLPEKGFNVARALVGTESTCVTILEAKLELLYNPPARSLLVLGYEDVYHAADHILEALEAGPTGLEGLDEVLIDNMIKKGVHAKDTRLLPEGKGWLMVEFGGETKADADDKAYRLMDALRKKGKDAPTMKLFDDSGEEDHLWKIRESGLSATARVPGQKDTWEGWEDSAVPPENMGQYLRRFRALLDRYGYACALYGHFGQGCLHTRIDFDLSTRRGIHKYHRFIHEAADLVLSLGGSCSGEHGDGQSRGELLEKMYGKELIQAFREFKSIWDPEWKMNPGKVVDPYSAIENLRLGAGFRPAAPRTHFKFPEDQGSFGYAALRCVGVGKCRREEGGTMCPSYMVTREEAHSTRGRAHILFEMLQDGAVKGGWRDEHVKQALDLCLSCKGCKGECPMYVDMATYKAEFLSHYYKGRLRPMSAYSMGLIPIWARLATRFPGMANFLLHTPGLSGAVKSLGGIHPGRKIPPFAKESFTRQLARRPQKNLDGPRVLLWADTFNNYFHPEIQMAALDVLESGGFRVQVPNPSLCCGRPLFDYGMLNLAKAFLRRILRELGPEIDAGSSLVVLEPSCAATFRDELINLFPEERQARKLADHTYLLSEFIHQRADDFKFPRLHRQAVLHGHCHHKSLMKMSAEEEVLEKLGVDFKQLDSGCCGMAGSFGYEKGDHYEVSMRAGERVLLPAVRQAPPDALIIADGFSCRSQIEDATVRKGLHLAQVYQMALQQGPNGPALAPPESAYEPRDVPMAPTARGLARLAAGAAAIGLAWLGYQRVRRALALAG